MLMRNSKKRKQYVVIGLGRFGSSIAQTLCEQGVQVLGLDKDQTRIEEMRDVLTQVVRINVLDDEAVAALGLSDFDGAVVSLASDVKTSCVAVMMLKEMGVPYVMAKAKDDFHGRMLTKLGADKVVRPEHEAGQRYGHNLVSGRVQDFIEISPEFSMAEIFVPEIWDGKTLAALHLRDAMNINVVAVFDGKEVSLPHAQTQLHIGEVLLVVADNEALSKLERRV